MLDWFNTMTTLQKIFTLIAFPSTLIFILQAVLLLLGVLDDGAGDIDDGDGIPESVGDDGLALFTVRGIMAFLAVGGWSGVFFIDAGIVPAAAITLALIVGFAALVGCALLIKLILKLQSNGNIQLSNAIGKVGQVYIPIPPQMSGSGKVNITIQDKYTEVTAMTSEGEPLKTGEMVRVVATDEVGCVIVERVKVPVGAK
ncbi:MAG: hypothetical protein J6I45_02685 [Clostridia bacterium]|nr:hypothetical protein [Clostridia bacterium]